jgi:5-methylcytosine-specific restriction enzyme subunit McrC
MTLVELREHEASELALTSAEAIALSATGIVDVEPAWTAGTFRLRAGATVGAVTIGDDLRLRIAPKIQIRRVVYLLCHAAGLATWDEHLIDLDDTDPIDSAVAHAFVTAAERVLKRGPRSAYYNVDDDLTEIRGRVDANRQRLRYGFPLPVAVTYDEYGVDTTENQLLAGAAMQLQRLPDLSTALYPRLRRLRTSLQGVQPARRDQARQPVYFTRLNEHYRPAVALARTVLEGTSFDLTTGARQVTGFTVNMNSLFEHFLYAALSGSLAQHDGQLRYQRSDHLDRNRQTRIIPDLTWIHERRPTVVIDAKYKDPSDGRPADSDIYQVVAYCVGLGTRAAYLVHATTAATTTLHIDAGGFEVVSTGLELTAPLADLRRQIQALADSVARPHEDSGYLTITEPIATSGHGT